MTKPTSPVARQAPPEPKGVRVPSGSQFRMPQVIRDNLFVLQREVTNVGLRALQLDDGLCPLCGAERHEERIAGCDYRYLPPVEVGRPSTLRGIIVLASDGLARALRREREEAAARLAHAEAERAKRSREADEVGE